MIAKSRGANTVRHVVIKNNHKVLRMHHLGASTVEIAKETGLTIRAVNLRRKKIRMAEEEGDLEYSPLHSKPYIGPICARSTLPLCQARQCSDDVIQRFMEGDPSVGDEVYRVIAQFQVGKEPSRPELAIQAFECSPCIDGSDFGFEPSSLPRT